MKKLGRGFYCGNTLEIARKLIGCALVSSTPEGMTAGRIVETEAYMGIHDRAAHAHRGDPSGRTRVLYGEGGHAYVFLIYGMHCCMNVVTGGEDRPECVLIRALEPIEGIQLMKARRKKQKQAELCSGPGKLCQAMDISLGQYGEDLTGNRLYILERAEGETPYITATPRINVDYAGEERNRPWRFVETDSPYLSVKRPRDACFAE